MTASVTPLTALSEAQRAQALSRLAIIRPALEDGVSQAQVARTHHLVVLQEISKATRGACLPAGWSA